MLWIPDFRDWITDFVTVELGLQIPIASGIPDSTSKNFPDSGNRITFHLAFTEKNSSVWTYNPGQKSLGQYCNIHIFLGSLLKQWIFFEIFLQFSLPPPYTKLKLGKILETRVQHCLWGEGRGWTCVNWKTPQKLKRVPRLLSMIVVPIIQTSRQIRIYNSYKLKGFPRFTCAVVISVFVCLVWWKSQKEIKVNLCKIKEFLFWFSDSSRALWESGDFFRSGGSKSLH